MRANDNRKKAWLDQPLNDIIKLDWETVIFVFLIALAIFSRFYDLESRVMSHDENSHVYYSWRFYKGEGFSHDPLMHGPFLFHTVALSYFMFGDNDFTARIPAALFSIATVGFMWFYRRYLGRAGALVAAALMVISPYMLYYGRYVRNEAYVGLFGVILIWGLLRYLETGKAKYLYWISASSALHFTTKETSFIYTAQALIFLAFYFLFRVTRMIWGLDELRKRFIVAIILALLFLGASGGYLLMNQAPEQPEENVTVSPVVPGTELTALPVRGLSAVVIIFGILGLLALITAVYFLFRGFSWQRLRTERSFSLLILLGTLVLPQLSAFPVRIFGWNIPTNASEVIAMSMVDILHFAIFLIPMTALAVVIGLSWNKRLWLINAGIFFGIFTVFYTSVFTNGAGFFTGLVGSLGYWLEQQGVERGSQPWYYYWLIQVPMYEYLPALGTILAALIAFGGVLKSKLEAGLDEREIESEIDAQQRTEYVLNEGREEQAPVFSLLIFWALSSVVAYSIAGEKMPWLTVHIAFPLVLCAAWGIGKLIEVTDWSALKQPRGWVTLILAPIFFLSAVAALGSLLGTQPPFQGQEMIQLQATSTFLTSLIAAFASGFGLFYLTKDWATAQIGRIFGLIVIAFLALLTARSAVISAFINYDNATELLVYAHSAGGIKTALSQIEEISERTTDGLAVQVAYDNETSYPYWWYLRNYSNSRYYGEEPTRSLRDVPLILVGDANFGKLEPLVGNQFQRFDYIRLWWPNQDYFNLTWQRVLDAFLDAKMRAALLQIWLNHDYSIYGEATGKDMSLPNWSPAARMRLYIRKDVINQLWNYGSVPSAEIFEPDPFEDKHIVLAADRLMGESGTEPGMFQRPRDLAVAPDGSLYIADTENNRIQHLDQDGSVLRMWGSFGDAAQGEAPGGAFNQPWGIGLAPDGCVYVADTWNHRIQKFSALGEFITSWGYFGQGETPMAFWGPRDVAVNSVGQVFVTDTGNKRVVVFDDEGNFITEFGSVGMGLGEFDEPVGIAIDDQDQVYVADAWNQRIQVFGKYDEKPGQTKYIPLRSWDVWAWYGQSLDNKPYLTVDNQGSVFIVDPEGYRVMQFTDTGEAVRAWGEYGTGMDKFGLVGSVAVDGESGVWITDTGNGRLMHFELPE